MAHVKPQERRMVSSSFERSRVRLIAADNTAAKSARCSAMTYASLTTLRSCFVATVLILTSACGNQVASHALVRPTNDTGRQAMLLLHGQPSENPMRFVYGYWPVGPTTCASPRAKPSTNDDRYGVLICDSERPLSVAYFVNPLPGASQTPREGANRRLASIASSTLVPIYVVSQP